MVVSTTRSSCGWPTIWRTWASIQSTKYCARWLASTAEMRTGVRNASSRSSLVITWVFSIWSSTTVARFSARSVSDIGL